MQAQIENEGMNCICNLTSRQTQRVSSASRGRTHVADLLARTDPSYLLPIAKALAM